MINFLAEPREKPNQRKNFSTRNNDSSDNSLDKPEEEASSVSENGLKPKKERIIDLAQEPLMLGKWKGLDPVVFLRDETVIEGIKAFYGIKDESFPLYGHLVTRNSDTSSKGNVKRIYYVSRSVKDVLEINFAVGKQLKIASVGLKMFVSTTYSSFSLHSNTKYGFLLIFFTDLKTQEKQSARECEANSCSFRITSEGLPVILPYMTKQILYATIADFKNLLQYKSIKFQDFVNPQFGQNASELAMGCCVVVFVNGMYLK